MASNSLPAIEKLSGRENYNTWKFALKTYLEHEELWECVEPPEGAVIDPKKDNKAKAKIILSIDVVNYTHVEAAKTAREAWQNLKDAFEDSGLTRRVGLLRILTCTRLENCESVDEYVNKIISTAYQLRNIKFNISDEWVGTLLLAGLPDQYRPMIMGIESSGIPISTDSIKVKLLQDVRDSTNENNTALWVKGEKFQKKKGPVTKGPRCFECGKHGHYARDCHRRRQHLQTSSVGKKALLTAALSAEKIETNEWYIDSGATTHITNGHNDTFKTPDRHEEVVTASNNRLPVIGIGDLELKIKAKGEEDSVILKDVMHVPSISTNLLSVSKMTQKGHKVIFDQHKCHVYDSEENLVATASQINGMYKLDRSTSLERVNIVSMSNLTLWHQRLGHPCRSSLKRAASELNQKLDLHEADQIACPTCAKGKQARYPFRTDDSKEHRAKRPLELIHSDLCGPLDTESIGGSRYFLTFIDDATRKVFVYFLRGKFEVAKYFREFKNLVENQCGQKIKSIRTDNGKEYVNEELKREFKKNGIQHQTTVPYSPQQNGLAERMNRTLMEKTRCILIEANLGKDFWAEAVNTATYLTNRLPTKALPQMTPEEAFTGKKPKLSELKVFGCRALVHTPKEKRKKLDPKSTDCVFLGYCENSKGYRLYNPTNKKIMVSRDVIFLEDQFLKPAEKKFERKFFVPIVSPEVRDADEEQETENGMVEDNDENGIDDPEIPTNEEPEDTEYEASENSEHKDADNKQPEISRKSQRITKRSKKLDDYITYFVENLNEDPVTVEDAARGPDSKRWEAAIAEEHRSLVKNKTFEVVDAPDDVKLLTTKWVFKKKPNDIDKTVKYKARLVVKGCAQTPGIDYGETYSPVVKHTSIRLLLAIAVKEDMDIDHMDVASAYLHGNIDEDVYVHPPKEFAEIEGKIWKLRKAMYGLKQSGRSWNKRLNEVLEEAGLTRSKFDPCVYYLKTENGILYLAVYVDDLLILSTNKRLKDSLKKTLQQKLEIKDLGEVRRCFGMNITRDRKQRTR